MGRRLRLETVHLVHAMDVPGGLCILFRICFIGEEVHCRLSFSRHCFCLGGAFTPLEHCICSTICSDLACQCSHLAHASDRPARACTTSRPLLAMEDGVHQEAAFNLPASAHLRSYENSLDDLQCFADDGKERRCQ
ncbi:uncharacterized protein LOC119186019 isoform X1 [Rhipicephalus microplus]|uniref:uncharacterized protein LOC119186019 isoform X1 n=1 Tax=Rhipicephalus microplus TaxID=6941 RepID=UPI003F6AAB49